MRRPVKPFVTEYKGPNRRPPQQTNAAERWSSEDIAFSAPHDTFSRNGGDHAVFAPSPSKNTNHSPGHHGEDSYEAAMRAADALFAPAPRAASPADSLSEASLAAQDAQPEFDAVFAAPSAGMSDSMADASQPGRGGRILRVLDEDPEPAMIAMEAEHAPKRRGRKPGSKNKPKEGFVAPKRQPAAREPAHFIFDHAEAPVMTAPARYVVLHGQTQVDPAALERATPRRGVSARRAPAPVAQEAMQGNPVENRTVATSATARNEPFSWVRIKLAPGEQWKRRLPKVCW